MNYAVAASTNKVLERFGSAYYQRKQREEDARKATDSVKYLDEKGLLPKK